MSQRHLATRSLQFLRGKAHALTEELWPDKKERYRWLQRNAPSIHMSQLQRQQLMDLIEKLENL